MKKDLLEKILNNGKRRKEMAREDIKKDNRDNLYLVIKELSLLSLLSF